MSDETKRTEPQHEGGISRRDLLRLTAATGAVAAVGAIAAVPEKAAAATSLCSGLQANEAFPTSPLILNPFTDPLPVPTSIAPLSAAELATLNPQPGPGIGQQDADGGTHQIWPGLPTKLDGTPSPVASYPAPLVYRLKMQTSTHAYTSSPVRTLVPYTDVNGKVVPAGTVVPQLPKTTIYGFNGSFYSTMIRAEYGKPVLVRIENHLDENPDNLDRGDFGDPELGFLTHLHNGHTAAESDGNPHHKPEAYQPGDWVDNLYLNYPAGGQDSEKQAFLWFHDHREGHTGANVYKGMAGLFPIYDTGADSNFARPGLDTGDETKGLRLPGVKTVRADGAFDVEYDLPLAIHDVALDDGAVAHQDFHNGCGEAHPEWFGKSYFRHFPNHGFVGDVFCVNGTAFPVLEVKRRKYRLRFLTAAIARQFELSFMSSAVGPKAAVDLGYKGTDLQGQYRLTDGKQCLRMMQIGSGGGLLPNAIQRDNIENWPGMRHEVVVDFTRTMDGKATRKGQVIWLVNTAKMPDGRNITNDIRLKNADAKYVTPIMKIVIGDDAPDNSLMPTNGQVLRPVSPLPSATGLAALPQRRFDMQRGGFGGEIQWLINGHPFELETPLAIVKQGQPEVWTITNGGGWSHPMHFHQEEHRMVTRNGKIATTVAGHQDDSGKDDICAVDPSEKIVIYRNFRTFKGKYVAHCHNLAHEDHSMMFGWIIE